MEPNSTDSFDPNQYYRIYNLGLGPETSLDVVTTQTTPPNGTVALRGTGAYSGQIWQFLELSDQPGHYYISTSFLGAKLKLDVLSNSRGDYAPHLRNFTADYNQTWKLTPHMDGLAGSRPSWTFQPDFIALGASGGLFSVYNDTLEPYLARPAPESQTSTLQKLQRWSVIQEGLTIDDPTFSATHLPALATEPAVLPEGAATVTPTATVTSTPIAEGSSNGNDSRLAGPVIAAAVVPTTVFALIVAGFCLFVYLRRRKLQRLDENHPYPQTPPSPRPHTNSSAFMSEIVDTFVEDPIDRWKRGNTRRPQGLTSLSLLSSNLSASLWSFRNPQESTATVVANPLSAPPLSRPKYRNSSPEHIGDVLSAPPSSSLKKRMDTRISFCEIEMPPSPLNPSKQAKNGM